MGKYYQENKEKLKNQQKKYYNEHKKEWINYALRKNYNITLNDYLNILKEQNECCAICGKHQSKINKPLFVDHCHHTGKVRGLICPNCNTALGHFNDDIELVRKALKYLEKYEKD